jgi:SEC-C motif-containing protein
MERLLKAQLKRKPPRERRGDGFAARSFTAQWAMSDRTLRCPCGLDADYATCCARWHRDLDATPDAEALMRSRYSAYVLGLSDQLLASWHPSTRPAAVDLGPRDTRWLGLEVRRHERLDDDHARVEFVARSKLGGRAQRLHETSRFVREGGRWYYLDGNVG